MPKKKQKTCQEEFTVSGKQVKETVTKLLREGNVRRIIIKHEGKVFMEIPITITALAVVLAPTLAAVGVLAALFTSCTIQVEKVDS